MESRRPPPVPPPRPNEGGGGVQEEALWKPLQVKCKVCRKEMQITNHNPLLNGVDEVKQEMPLMKDPLAMDSPPVHKLKERKDLKIEKEDSQ